jgi:hypothetical protein
MLATNLIGRKINQFAGAESTIVAIFVDRGEIKGVAENPDHMLFEFDISGMTLIPEPEEDS